MLFGRVPKAAVFSLGLGALAFLMALALVGLTTFNQGYSGGVRDFKAAVSVRR